MRKFNVNVNGKAYQVEVDEVSVNGAQAPAQAAPVAAPAPVVQEVKPAVSAAPAASGGFKVESPMPGVVLDIKAANGKAVKTGEVLLVLEAMKMENEITAPKDGVVNIVVTKGASVNSGDVLATIN